MSAEEPLGEPPIPARSPEDATERSPAAERFWRDIWEDEERFLSEPMRWPRATNAGWRVYGKGQYLCLYCLARFRWRSKKKVPHFCSTACKASATRLRAEYREAIIRRLDAEGASDYTISGETGLSPNVAKQKRFALRRGVTVASPDGPAPPEGSAPEGPEEA